MSSKTSSPKKTPELSKEPPSPAEASQAQPPVIFDEGDSSAAPSDEPSLTDAIDAGLEDSKPQTEEAFEYEVLSPISHDNKFYGVGERIKLTAFYASQLYPHNIRPIQH